MPAYMIADVQVNDPEAYQDYAKGVPATVAAHGGRYLARGGAVRVLEGGWAPRRTVVIEFPSMEALTAWYESPEYRPLRELRQRVADSRLVAVEGL
ncbi:MAG: DUF1330 domain-containing protein [Burkholderiales bacterium]|nr:MAG: DUF1330 domain-containing protein [Burkholderiales bacterium]